MGSYINSKKQHVPLNFNRPIIVSHTMCAVKPRIPEEKLASVATESGKHTSVHSNEKTELSRTKGTREENEMGEDIDKKDREEWKFCV